MLPNTNPATGYAFGYVQANDLDSEVVAILLGLSAGAKNFTDYSYNDALAQAIAKARSEWEDQMERAMSDWQDKNPLNATAPSFDNFEFDEDKFNDEYEAYEPIVEGIYQDVHYRSSWLGGALNFFISYSPFITVNAHRASPCVPNAGILVHPDRREGDVLAYDVAPYWWHDWQDTTQGFKPSGDEGLTLQQREKAVAYAEDRYCICSDDNIEIDGGVAEDPKNFSEGDNGTFVRAWLWVPRSAYTEG